MTTTPKNPYMSTSEMEEWISGSTTTTIGDYTIKPKRDFGNLGFWDAATRSSINTGWVITKDGCLATPGAGWYHTKDEAVVGVHLLIASNGNAEMYHALSAAMYGAARSIAVKIEMAAQYRANADV